jgi:hypothetical protein
MTFKCHKCGKQYENYKCRKDLSKFCSKACFDESRRHYRRCLECGKIFPVKLTDVERGAGKFCSRLCTARYHNLHKIFTCICGKKVSRKPSQSKGKVYCSQTCFIISRRCQAKNHTTNAKAQNTRNLSRHLTISVGI